MDGRDAFLTMARDKHYEFSSLRRAQFSTLSMLYELHNQGQDKFVYTCNNCKNHVETRYHCTICDVRKIVTIRYFRSILNAFPFFLLRISIYVFHAKRKLDISTRWNVWDSISTMDHRQLTVVRNQTHKKLANSQYSDAYNHWSTHVSVAMQIVVFRHVKR